MKKVKSLALIILGNLLLAAGVSYFLIPTGFVSGGVTGIALILHHYFHTSVSVGVLTLNILLLIVGFFSLGKGFLATTMLSSLLYPLFLNTMEHFPLFTAVNQDPLLCAVYAGLLSGLGLGLVFKEGSSTGGTDIPVLILNRRFGISLEAGLYITDGIIILAQAGFSDSFSLLYGLLVMLLSSFVIGRIELRGHAQIELIIVSPSYEEIRDRLLHTLDTGATLLHIDTGFQRTRSFAVLTVIPRRKLMETTRLIEEIDKAAFITIHEVKEVHGRGFSLQKIYHPEINTVKNNAPAK
ncbi:MAG: YitT family protein [Eubacteriales bacterium]|nr:YitT family protein [Eubacteriales bacterium]